MLSPELSRQDHVTSYKSGHTQHITCTTLRRRNTTHRPLQTRQPALYIITAAAAARTHTRNTTKSTHLSRKDPRRSIHATSHCSMKFAIPHHTSHIRDVSRRMSKERQHWHIRHFVPYISFPNASLGSASPFALAVAYFLEPSYLPVASGLPLLPYFGPRAYWASSYRWKCLCSMGEILAMGHGI